MTWALALGRSSFAIALGILVGAGAAVVGARIAADARDVVIVPPEIHLSGAGLTLPAPEPVTLVDVSRSGIDQTGGVGGLVPMLGLHPDEALVSVGGRVATRGFDALVTAWDAARPGDFVDLELAASDAARPHRRVLILVHP